MRKCTGLRKAIAQKVYVLTRISPLVHLKGGPNARYPLYNERVLQHALQAKKAKFPAVKVSGNVACSTLATNCMPLAKPLPSGTEIAPKKRENKRFATRLNPLSLRLLLLLRFA